MINAYHLTYGDIVMYHGGYLKFIGIYNKFENAFDNRDVKQAFYEGNTGLSAAPDAPDIVPVPLSKELLQLIGFSFETLADGIVRACLGDYVNIYIDKDGMDVEILTADITVSVTDIRYFHELQECMRTAGLHEQAEIIP